MITLNFNKIDKNAKYHGLCDNLFIPFKEQCNDDVYGIMVDDFGGQRAYYIQRRRKISDWADNTVQINSMPIGLSAQQKQYINAEI
jgi:hypothetical protein